MMSANDQKADAEDAAITPPDTGAEAKGDADAAGTGDNGSTGAKTDAGKAEEGALDRAGQQAIKDALDLLERVFNGYWDNTFLGLKIWRYLSSLILLILTFLFSRSSRFILRHHFGRLTKLTKTDLDDLVFTSAIQPAALFIQSVGIYLALVALLSGEIPATWLDWLGRTSRALAVAAVFWYGYRLIDVLDRYLRRLAARSDNDLDNAIVEVIRKSLKVFVLVIAMVTIGKYIMGWQIGALVASAGIVGLAVAFAAQDTIANLFGTFMLLLDRPFRVGERVVIGDVDGPVESIGFRSTRIRTMNGNLVSIPNKTTADSVVENIGRRPHIKWPFVVGLVYDTPYDKMVKGVEILREIFKDHQGLDPELPPRVYFSEFAAFSLNISVTVWYHGVARPLDWWEYQEWREKTNFEIMRRFEEAGLEFAFPTQTVYLAQDNNRPLAIKTSRQESGNQS
jgi:MscS family membrane protein